MKTQVTKVRTVLSVIALAWLLLATLFTTSVRAEDVKFDCITAKVTGITDGDTYTMYVPAWPDTFNRLPLRPIGVDTPEMRSQCPDPAAKAREEALAAKAKGAATGRLIGKVVQVCNFHLGPFNRIIGTIYLGDEDVGKWLLNTGLARPYVKGTDPWCSQ